jgi:protein TonB
VGGEISAPTQLVRVPPVYPEIAARAQIQGLVIIEATVDETGHVRDAKVLRSVKFLDEAAIHAVKQWQYSPLLLNGHPMPFILTVTVSFRVDVDGR